MLRVYLMDVSYFSGKLEAYLRYKGIAYERVEVGWRQLQREVLPNTGLMKVPTAVTPAGEWLQDSTPMIDFFEARHPRGAVIPDDPLQAYACRLLEDYADEWLWRPALHYRWSHEPDAKLLSGRIAREVMKDLPGPVSLKAAMVRRRQRALYVRGDGVDARSRSRVEAVYRDCLAQLEAVLEKRRFLLGARPCLADFGFFASMFRHFSLDPTPARIMRDSAPRVYAWVARLWNARHESEVGAWDPGIPEAWRALLEDVAACYLPYLHANAVAWREGRPHFDFASGGFSYRALPVVRYRVWCRERLQQHFEALPAEAQPRTRERLEAWGVWEPLWRDGVIASGLDPEGLAPLCRPSAKGPGQRLRLLADGTGWNPPPAA